MSDSWIEFFELVCSVIQEADTKGCSTSTRVIESIADKVEHCIRGVTRLDRVAQEEIDQEGFSTGIMIYLHTCMQSLLVILHNEHRKWQDKLANSMVDNTDRNDSLLPDSVVVVHTSLPGRPSLSLDIDTVIFLRNMNFKWTDIAEMMGVSRSTLYRQCTDMELHHPSVKPTLTYNELLPVVINIKKEFADMGERLLLGMIRARGIRCTRETLRKVIHDVDPINTTLRWNAKLYRRTYSVPGPNSLWHIGKYNYSRIYPITATMYNIRLPLYCSHILRVSIGHSDKCWSYDVSIRLFQCGWPWLDC